MILIHQPHLTASFDTPLLNKALERALAHGYDKQNEKCVATNFQQMEDASGRDEMSHLRKRRNLKERKEV